MFTTRDTFNGAAFDYENGACKANGEFRHSNSSLNAVSINGTYDTTAKSYKFWASRDASGNLNLNGVPKEVIVEVAVEIKAIVAEIEALNEEE